MLTLLFFSALGAFVVRLIFKGVPHFEKWYKKFKEGREEK